MRPPADVLPDVLAPGLKVVFCGTAASPTSAAVGAYYAGPGNRFWPTLHRVGLTPILLAPQNFREVLRYGIGLTDVVKSASGTDDQLSMSDFAPDGLRRKIIQYTPQYLAFNGKRAAHALLDSVDYGLQPLRLGQTRLFVLPSTSGAARRYWDEALWHDLAERVSNF